MTWVKVCGVCREQDVTICVAAGVDALGFVVDYPVDVPWNISVERAGALASLVPPGIERVAVVGEDASSIVEIAEALRPAVVQLHADEDPEATAGLVEHLHAHGVRVAKALRFDVASGRLVSRHSLPVDPLAVGALYAAAGVDLLLVDSISRDRPAGTGRTVDMRVARRIRDGVGLPVVLAGGLNAGNVAAAIAAVEPYGVDVISGVENPVGCKDPELVRAFVAAARKVGA